MLCISISLVLLYINIILIVVRERSFVYSDSVKYSASIPIRVSAPRAEKASPTMAVSNYRQETKLLTGSVVQSAKPVVRAPRRQNPCAHARTEFVTKRHAKNVYMALMRRRDLQLDAYVRRVCKRGSDFAPCSYMGKANKSIKRRNSFNVDSHFNSLQYTPTGSVCEGCRAKITPKFLFKTAVKDLLIRKFVGNEETAEIYTAENRRVRRSR